VLNIGGILAALAEVPATEAVKMFLGGVTLAIALFIAMTKTGKRR
jgi:hypothetical protein